jgi:hypothetical protein
MMAVDMAAPGFQFRVMRRILVLLTALSCAAPAIAQDWSDVAPTLRRDLTNGRTPIQTFFFPDLPDPATATRALGLAYVHIEGSAGSASLDVGLFRRAGGAWTLHRRVEGLYGFSPRDPQLGPNGFFVTTDTLGPNDPRCCPSVVTRWYLDWESGAAEPVN